MGSAWSATGGHWLQCADAMDVDRLGDVGLLVALRVRLLLCHLRLLPPLETILGATGPILHSKPNQLALIARGGGGGFASFRNFPQFFRN